jgi:tetraacyldisaccharide 4'-kinase
MKSSFKDRINENLRSFEQFTVDVIYDRRQGRNVRWFGVFLRLLSFLYGAVVSSRLWLYNYRIIKNQPLGCLVIVVGNLTVGGTGKTPIVERIARTLKARGRTVGILSRGYKSKKEPAWKRAFRAITHGKEPDPKVVSDGKRVLLDSRFAGDEPYMLAKNLPGVVVVVDKNRVKAGAYAIKRFGVDTLILDDGFQYLPLKGRLNLVLVDKNNPFGNGHLLPRGILREPMRNIRRASYVFITKSDGQDSTVLRNRILDYKPDVDIIECTHRPTCLTRLDGAETLPLEALQGKKVGCFSGIAVPESFEKFLIELGAMLVVRERFIDHHRFTDYELGTLYEKVERAGLDWVITTEKDAARLDVDYVPPVTTYFLRLEIDIIDGADDFEEAIGRICFPKKDRMRAKTTSVNPPTVP